MNNQTAEPTDDGHEAAVTAKITAMCVLFCASMTLGCLPIKLAQWLKWGENGVGARNNIYVKMLLCLGGGVLMCTTFLHLLPEVGENLEELENFPDIGLPFAQLLMCIGFFLMYFIEECVHYYLHRREKNLKNNNAFDPVDPIRRSFSISRGQFKLSITDDKDVIKEKSDQTIEDLSHLKKHAHHDHNGHSHADHSHVIVEDATIVTIRGLLVVLALSIHELFEGLSVGLESSSGTVWYMFGAVSAHKLVIAFCIGVELVASKMRTYLTVIYIFTFAIVSPLGIGIGIIVSDENNTSTQLPSVLLQGLASGTLLYVVFFEILSSDRKSGIKQYVAVLVGFILMAALTLIEGGHSHGHGHSHDH